ncbi:hypothetical protein HWQ46_20240 [Shewanella sp. D64]|uniref:hypothetical protein n=1 Tax=unclassified Shewanella TaxID=196818 RepID=UPI0022BA1599|nr:MULTISPECIES: hypothetical protein [unclassified Shewanella]MEC4727868.1 hypothetical protein [Shewanella sp. D64]MEC4739910.1 hypothetical protein [Shewanella sp. E94]WBJ97125.1 hypothetical protein HWQ47_08470 [Shewanella sp. MTB7]
MDVYTLMLCENLLSSQLLIQAAVFGIQNSFFSPATHEIFVYAGFDFPILDTEHLLISDKTFTHYTGAAFCSVFLLLNRLTNDNPARTGTVLDSSSADIAVSIFSYREIAKNIILARKYRPVGHQWIIYGRISKFCTLYLRHYIDLAKRETLVCLMNECPDGFSTLPDIVELAHIYMVIESALDQSLSLSYGTQVTYQNVQTLIHKMATCQAKTPILITPEHLNT